MAADNTQDISKKAGSSLVMQIGALAVATAIAAGVGLFSGNYLGHNTAPVPQAQNNTAHASILAAPVATSAVTPFEPIITNLSDPATTLIRLELSAISPQSVSTELISTVHQDLLAFVRTLKLHQISGASGFQHMRSELRERVRTRSDGAINDVLIRAFILE